jgi:glycosyltransferase involved in cell wall biosynthesis
VVHLRIAWVTHRPFDDFGGAERADRQMLERRPDGVDVMLIRPGGVDEDLADFDRIVVAGIYGFSTGELHILARLRPIVWAHDMQFTGHWLYDEASHFIALNQIHLDWEKEKNLFKRTQLHLNPGWMDTTELYGEDRRVPNTALWAHRDIDHKGLDLAIAWANENDKELFTYTGRSHDEVLETMKRVQYFILLSKIRDPGPFSVMEAQLCGCELVLDNVGYWPDVDELREKLNDADKQFWGLVCGSQ